MRAGGQGLWISTLGSIALLMVQDVDAAAGAALADTIATKLCTISAQAKKTAANMAAKIASATAAAQAATTAQSQQELAALMLEHHREAALTLKIYARLLKESAHSALETWDTAKIKAAGQTMYTSGRIDELITLLQKHQKDTAGNQHNCIAVAANGNWISPAQHAKCGDSDTTTAAGAQVDLSALLSQQLANTATLEAAAATNCLLTKQPTYNGEQPAAGIPLLEGLFKVPTAGGLETDASLETKIPTNKLLKHIAAHGKAIKTATEGELESAPTTAEAINELLKDSQSRSKLKPALAELLNWETEPEMPAIDSKVKSIFGITADNKEGAYVAALRQLSPTVKTAATKTGKVQLFSLDSKQLAEAINTAMASSCVSESKSRTCSSATPETSNDQSDSEDKICGKFHDKPKECPNKTCTYDTKTNKCNPIKAAEAPGTGDAKKEEKCTGKSQDVCTKDSGCKWEGETCKDSSFLASKQFALIVSAAFVALLF